MSGERIVEDDFFYNSSRLEIVEEYLYLGIIFKPSGSFSAAVSRLTEQARKAIFKLNQVCFGAPSAGHIQARNLVT